MNLEQMEQNSAQAVVLLKAMANERRLQILCLLHNQELSVGELCSKLELSQSALSQHLAWLRRDGLVETRKEAQTVFYTLSSNEVKAMIELLHGLYCAR
ncbi:TPA: ArsR/SmtB family transcription factor [Vibrio metschnikovii]|jgi:DNA-binding transcriptional ArsR family regulator|uniref:Metalloregulator ArsR/SmtB family transcription factor n=1 Tax=bacterium 19MO03SA05 TaxID=2920620 RepID=A0AAU6VI40_UNCXX|nr:MULTISPECIES: metalloregulator ArsR/SmtB family transcription factor [Vibrio]EKO3565791.1 winged helix-turn-helix transcriptional regulator [Vibrio metschnikovii]EKO3575961.1 winged helix-turn-helix transcriptional regulator [Vibrio metschnikovii]EKO3578155.1 winged helix-turn-helix transcriptional regulator [Vibrio metschnikovii]EKO3596339.1 winged helix-turn-helix transcriptional regulator [Vibrio metschnikovii]EKO3600884.1 winged helix-turn-helix transcriptional regulator [Vibrio metschn